MSARASSKLLAVTVSLAVLACQNATTPTTGGGGSTVTTVKPSQRPTGSPTAAPSPSASVSPKPTATPAPSASPSPTPTAIISASPTATPTAAPSMTPTPTPDLSPSPSPTPTPTPTPTPSANIQYLASPAYTAASLAGGQLTGTGTGGTGDDAYIAKNTGAVGCHIFSSSATADPVIFISSPKEDKVFQSVGVANSLLLSGVPSVIKQPLGVYFDGATRMLYVADSGQHRIIRIAFTGNTANLPELTLENVAGSATADPATITYAEGNAKGSGAVAPLLTPCAVTRVGDAIFVLDSAFHTLSRIVLTGDYPLTFVAGGKNRTAGTAVAGPVAGNAARFNAPMAMCAGKRDGVDTVYVADTGNHCIRAIVVSTGQVTTIAGSLTGVKGHDDGVGTAARFDTPLAIAADHNGNVYVGESGTPRLRRIAADGTTTTLAGGSTAGFADGNGATALLGGVAGLSSRLDDTGKLTALYWVDMGTPSEGARVRVLKPKP